MQAADGGRLHVQDTPLAHHHIETMDLAESGGIGTGDGSSNAVSTALIVLMHGDSHDVTCQSILTKKIPSVYLFPDIIQFWCEPVGHDYVGELLELIQVPHYA